MKANDKKNESLTFGNFIAAMYRDWGSRRGQGLVRLAVNAQLVVFRGQQRFEISEDQDENLSFRRSAE